MLNTSTVGESVENIGNSRLEVNAQYELIQMISPSLQGQIWKALHVKTNTVVVVKKVFTNYIKSKETRNGDLVHEDFVTECKIIWKLCKKPHFPSTIVRILNCWESENACYGVFEYCEGGDLFQYIAARFKVHFYSYEIIEHIIRVRKIFCDLVIAVEWLHKHHVVHCDLSLENCFFHDKDQQNIKLGDFGLAQTSLYHSGLYQIGKTGYMSPEMYEEVGCNLKLNDVWCLGVMLFMMLCGLHPYLKPTKNDSTFPFIIRGCTDHVIESLQRSKFVPEGALDIMNGIFRMEHERFNMRDLMKHPWLKDVVKLRKISNDKKLHR